MHSTPPSRYDGIPAARGTQVLASPIEPASLPSCERDRLRERNRESEWERHCVQSLSSAKEAVGIVYSPIFSSVLTQCRRSFQTERDRETESARERWNKDSQREIERESERMMPAIVGKSCSVTPDSSNGKSRLLLSWCITCKSPRSSSRCRTILMS